MDTGSISGDQYDWSETQSRTVLATARAAWRRNNTGITGRCKQCELARWMSQLFLLYSLVLCSPAAQQRGWASWRWTVSRWKRADSPRESRGCSLELVGTLAPPSYPCTHVRLSPNGATPVWIYYYLFFLFLCIPGGISSWRLNPDSESKEVNSKSSHSSLIMPARWDSRRQMWTGAD